MIGPLLSRKSSVGCIELACLRAQVLLLYLVCSEEGVGNLLFVFLVIQSLNIALCVYKSGVNFS